MRPATVRRRSRSGWSRRGGSVASRVKGSTGTPTTAGWRLGVAGAFAVEPEPLDPPAPSLRALPTGGPADEPPATFDPTAERIVLAIVNEAYRAVGEGVADPSDVDLALRLGAGHPSGPFERVSAFGGPAAVLARLGRWRRAGPRFEPAPALVAAAEAAI